MPAAKAPPAAKPAARQPAARPQSLPRGIESHGCVSATPDKVATQFGTANGDIWHANLALGSPDDPAEREADRISESALAVPPPRPPKVGSGSHPKAGWSGSAAAVPPSVEKTLAMSGQPLPGGLRRHMERRFGHDFSRVRIHTDAPAQKSARELQAEAYAVGTHVVFGEGRFAPSTPAGRRLLAHELAHVMQSAGNRPIIRRQEKPSASSSGQTMARSVKIPPGTKSVQEFRRYAETVIFGRVLNLSWNAGDLTKGLYADIAKSVGASVTFQFPASLFATHGPKSPTEQAAAKTEADKQYGGLAGDDRRKTDAEIDRRFYASIEAAPGTPIKAGETGKVAIWNSLKEQVLTDRRAIDALPEDIKKVIFAGGPDARTLEPADYTQLLNIARKLASLTPEARKDYLARINASTTSLRELETSVNAYLRLQQMRAQQLEENETSAKPLFGAEDVYTRYRYYKLYLKNAESNLDGNASKEEKEMVRGWEESGRTVLLAALKEKNFDSIAEFEAAIEAYRLTFRTQAVNLALDVIARYDHMIFEARKKLQQPGTAAAIVQGIASSKAPALYQEAKNKDAEARKLRHKGMTGDMWQRAKKYDAEAESARAEAAKEVERGSGNDWLVAARGTDHEKLAGLDASGAQSYLTQTLEARAADSQTARQEFIDDPNRVFKLDDLVAASKQIQGIAPDTVYGKIIDDYIADEKSRHLISAIAMGVLALALALLVPGGGWVAAAALLANASLSTYQAYTAYKEYEEQERDYNLSFLSTEPSLFWVGVAIGAAALDLGMAGSMLIKQSAVALKALEGPLLQFSKDGELANLIAKIEAADLNKVLKVKLEQEAETALRTSREAWKDAVGGSARLNGFLGVPIPDPGMVRQGFRALFYQVKRGVNTIAKLRADAKYLDAVGDITRMTGAERAELEVAFEEVKELVKRGRAKSMDDASLLGYVDRWSINRGKPGFAPKMLEEINAWKPLTAEQQQALNALNLQKSAVSTLYEQKAIAEAELAALRAKPQRTAEDIAEIRQLENELSSLDPVAHPPRTPQKGPGKIAEAEKTLAQKEVDAARAELTLYDRLRAAAPSTRAQQDALKGVLVDQVGVLKTKPTALQADHIVSVREIADMDGFSKLLWKDQKAIIDARYNLIAMDGAANASKGDRTWRSWSNASKFYDAATIEAMAAREANVRALIQGEIKEKLAALAAAKP